LTQREEQLTQREEELKTLERKLDEMSDTNYRMVEENASLRRGLETSEKLNKENTDLRYANDAFKIEYDRLVEELKDREKDEEKFMLQVRCQFYFF
jgi:hypothetical protein